MGDQLIGIDLGGTSCKFALVTVDGQILHQWAIPTRIEDKGQHIVPDMIQSIKEEFSRKNFDLGKVIGIGMGSPGQIDRKNRTVIGAYNLNWQELQLLGQQFEEAFHLPFFMDNDANVAALGERWLGAGNQSDNMIFVTLGTGVGSGLVTDGHLLHGVRGSAGEAGHITVERDKAFACTCGKKGCLETVASATGIVNLAKRALQETSASFADPHLLACGNDFTAKDIFDAAKSGDRLAEEVIDQFADYLGLALSHLANTLNPEIVVIGGGVSKAGNYLLEKLKPAYEKNLFPQVLESSTLKLAQLGNDAGVIGAAALVLTEFVQKEAE